MFARVNGPATLVKMRRVRRCEMDHFHGGIGEKFVECGVPFVDAQAFGCKTTLLRRGTEYPHDAMTQSTNGLDVHGPNETRSHDRGPHDSHAFLL
jgi:hypothetical protein